MKNLQSISAITIVLVMGLIGVFVARAGEDKDAHSQSGQSGHVMTTPGDLKWADGPPSLPSGAKFTIIEGNPKEPGPFTMRLTFPADYKIPPHSHPGVEHVTVISGIFHIGMGDKLDPAKGKALSAGSFALMPEGTNHFAWASEETVVQLHGIGPWGVNYVNSADDPRKQPSKQ